VTQARLNAALKLDPLVLGDPGSTIVSFDPARGQGMALPPPDAQEDGLPMLEIDPAIFTPRLRR
jgi:hypothetical protein